MQPQVVPQCAPIVEHGELDLELRVAETASPQLASES